MLDLKFIRENPELVKEGIKNKNEKDRVDEVLKWMKIEGISYFRPKS